MPASSRNGGLCRRFLHSRLRKVTGAQRAPLWSLWGKQRSFPMRCRAAFTQHFHRFGIGFQTCFRNLFLSLRMTCIAVMVATTPEQKGKGIQHQAGGQLDCGVRSTFAVPDFQHNTDHKAHQQHCANAKQPPHKRRSLALAVGSAFFGVFRTITVYGFPQRTG